MVWLNSGADDVDVTIPENEWVQAGEVVLSTDPTHPQGTPVRAGEVLRVGARSVVVLRQT
jgi:glycogen operon protein